MAHNEPPNQDLHCLQIQLFSSLVVKELSDEAIKMTFHDLVRLQSYLVSICFIKCFFFFCVCVCVFLSFMITLKLNSKISKMWDNRP